MTRIAARKWGIPEESLAWSTPFIFPTDSGGQLHTYVKQSDDLRTLVATRKDSESVAVQDSDTGTQTDGGLTDAIYCEGTHFLPETQRIALLIEETKVICSADVITGASKFIREAAQGCLTSSERTGMIEIPLPALAGFNISELADFFEQLHSRSLLAKSKSEQSNQPKIDHSKWCLSWVHATLYLQMESLFSYIADLTRTTIIASAYDVEMFCAFVELSKHSVIHQAWTSNGEQTWQSKMEALIQESLGKTGLSKLLCQLEYHERIARAFGEQGGTIFFRFFQRNYRTVEYSY